MEITQETRNIIIDINEFSNNKLKNRNDVSLLFEALRKDDSNKQLFKDLIFTAKYLNGLGKVMMNSMTGKIDAQFREEDKAVMESSAEKIREEYQKNIELLISQINTLLLQTDKDDMLSFKDRYLSMTRSSMVNLTSLIYDLSWVKKYYNEKKIL